MVNDQPVFSYRHDPNVPSFPDSGPVCVMDANCALCARGATWIAHHDKLAEFKIVPLQSDLGKALVIHYAMDPADPTSWLFLEDGRAYTSLDATMRVGLRLGGLWRVFGILHMLPRGLRDRLYRFVATNRYRWFGTDDLCALPDAEVQKRLMK